MFQKFRSIMNAGSVMGFFLQALPVAILAGAALVFAALKIPALSARKH